MQKIADIDAIKRQNNKTISPVNCLW